MGRMKEIAMHLENGDSVYEVGRKMKVHVNVIKALVATRGFLDSCRFDDGDDGEEE